MSIRLFSAITIFVFLALSFTAAAQTRFTVNQKVEVEQDQTWRKATIVEIEGDSYLISYDGTFTGERVSASRIRLINNKTANTQKPQGSVVPNQKQFNVKLKKGLAMFKLTDACSAGNNTSCAGLELYVFDNKKQLLQKSGVKCLGTTTRDEFGNIIEQREGFCGISINIKVPDGNYSVVVRNNLPDFFAGAHLMISYIPEGFGGEVEILDEYISLEPNNSAKVSVESPAAVANNENKSSIKCSTYEGRWASPFIGGAYLAIKITGNNVEGKLGLETPSRITFTGTLTNCVINGTYKWRVGDGVNQPVRIETGSIKLTPLNEPNSKKRYSEIEYSDEGRIIRFVSEFLGELRNDDFALESSPAKTASNTPEVYQAARNIESFFEAASTSNDSQQIAELRQKTKTSVDQAIKSISDAEMIKKLQFAFEKTSDLGFLRLYYASHFNNQNSAAQQHAEILSRYRWMRDISNNSRISMLSDLAKDGVSYLRAAVAEEGSSQK